MSRSHPAICARRYAASAAHLRQLADSLGRQPTQLEYNDTRPPEAYIREWIHRRMGGWEELCEEAGILHLPRVGRGIERPPGEVRTMCECGKGYIVHELRVACGGGADGTMLLWLCDECYKLETT